MFIHFATSCQEKKKRRRQVPHLPLDDQWFMKWCWFCTRRCNGFNWREKGKVLTVTVWFSDSWKGGGFDWRFLRIPSMTGSLSLFYSSRFLTSCYLWLFDIFILFFFLFNFFPCLFPLSAPPSLGCSMIVFLCFSFFFFFFVLSLLWLTTFSRINTNTIGIYILQQSFQQVLRDRLTDGLIGHN